MGTAVREEGGVEVECEVQVGTAVRRRANGTIAMRARVYIRRTA